NEAQQILATEQAMRNQENGTSTSDQKPSGGSGGGLGANLSDEKQMNQSSSPSSQGEQLGNKIDRDHENSSPLHSNSGNSATGNQNLMPSTQQEYTPEVEGERKQGSRAVDRLNQQRKSNTGTTKTAPTKRMSAPSMPYNNVVENDGEGQEEVGYSTRPQRKVQQKMNRQTPKPTSKQVPKRPEKTNGREALKPNKPQTE
ncbi:hypothetical protein, partial [Listeria fleischmannii]|uniref:hypothetical protein n=1 Tax=Listeria fleischmannii TaxID=1069827 RepID=UPI00162A1D8E